MSITGLLRRLLPGRKPSQGHDLLLPRLGESRPRGHFREFTVPRRRQRGGPGVPHAGSAASPCPPAIVPCTGGNIP